MKNEELPVRSENHTWMNEVGERVEEAGLWIGEDWYDFKQVLEFKRKADALDQAVEILKMLINTGKGYDASIARALAIDFLEALEVGDE